MGRLRRSAHAPIRVVIADDHPVIVAGVTAELHRHADIQVVGTAATFAATIALLASTPADVLILDLTGMQGSPIATITTIREHQPQIGIVVFSSMINMVAPYIRAGITGYVAKDDDLGCLITAIHSAAHQRAYYSPTIAAFLENTLPPGQSPNLTQRETDVLRLMARGLGTLQIAEELDIKPHSVQNLVGALRQKTGCLERVELVAWYRRVSGETDPWQP